MTVAGVCTFQLPDRLLTTQAAPVSGLPWAVDNTWSCPAGGDGWLAQLTNSVTSMLNAAILGPLGLARHCSPVRPGIDLEVQGPLIHCQRGLFGRLG